MIPNHKTNSIIIEASAGSGKTYQLINRLIRLLIRGAAAEEIVAITFTRKAAAEMQIRLEERLYQLAIIDEVSLQRQLESINIEPTPVNNLKARALYEQVLFSPQTIRCTTFHSFCQDILKRFPFEAEVPPGFELSEQTYLYKQQAWVTLMAECSENKFSSSAKAVAFLFTEFGLNTTHNLLDRFIDQRSDWWAWTQQANNPVGFAISQLQNAFNISPDDNPLDTFFNQPKLEPLLDKFNNCLSQLKAEKFKNWQTVIGYIRDPLLGLEERFIHLQDGFLTKSGEPRSLKTTSEMKKAFGDQSADEFIENHYLICNKIIKLKDEIALIHNFEINRQCYIAAHAMLEHYQEIKYSLRQLDFTDLEWQTYRLLIRSQHALWVQYKLDASIKHLLVDEFQDTNPLQWQLLKPLLEEFSQNQTQQENSGLDPSVLLVGDTKQSIYRFRRAEPKLFPIASNFIENNFNCQRQQLNSSWRSSIAIVNFVNKIFTEDNFAKQIPDFPEHSTELTALSGQVTLLNYPAINNSDKDEQSNVMEFRNPLVLPRMDKTNACQQEAEIIAKKINQLIDEQTIINKKEKQQPLQYQDIIILIRNRTNANYYEQALHKANIPFIGSERGTLLDCLEIKDMIMLLNWLITPFNNIALASILRSPLFSLPEQLLIEIAQLDTKTHTGQTDWFNRLKVIAEKNTSEYPLDKTIKSLQHWQELASKIPVHDLLDTIYSEADVLTQYHRAFPAHLKARTQSNLTRLIELALEMDSGRYPSLQQFLAHIEQLKTLPNEAPDAPAASSDINRVQVMTIHASKGLEAPVVFLANADAGNDDTDKYTYNILTDWPADNDRPDIMLFCPSSKQRDSFTRSLIEKDIRNQNRETANLFYVAITRARQYLYISAAKENKKQSDWFSLIRQCYQLQDNEELELMLEQYQPDKYKQSSCEKPTRPSIPFKIDNRLREYIQLPTRFIDIKSTAPSNTDSEHNFSDSQTLQDLNHHPDIEATNRGIIIHSILEAITEDASLTAKECQQKYAHDIHQSLWDELWSESVQLVNDQSLAFIFNNDCKNYNEISVSFLQNNITVYGIIDRLIVSDKSIAIVDYKTHQTVTQDNIAEHASRYRLQLQYYQQAVKKIWPQHSSQCYLVFTHNKLLYEFKNL